MSTQVKIILYAMLVILAGVSGFFALSNFGRIMDRAGNRTSELEQIEPETRSSEPVVPPAESPADTNLGSTAVTISTNIAAVSNAPPLLTNQVATSPTETNAIAGVTNPPIEPAAPTDEIPTAAGSTTTTKAPGGGRIGLWTALFILSIIGLGFLIASDVSHFMGNRALKTLYNDEGEGVKNPEYEEAEQVWANGRHLEAIGLMRDYLKKNPREQHVALRIAEIYEKDLGNYLAAALEYEEVLNHKLPPDRWGWAAIHLCNLYFKLNQEQKGYALLRRIVKEYPQTPAAEKARKRLEQVDGASFDQLPTESNVAPRPASEPSEQSGPPSNLPPGFRPKK